MFGSLGIGEWNILTLGRDCSERLFCLWFFVNFLNIFFEIFYFKIYFKVEDRNVFLFFIRVRM